MKTDLTQLILDVQDFESRPEETFHFNYFLEDALCGTLRCFLGENVLRHPDKWTIKQYPWGIIMLPFLKDEPMCNFNPDASARFFYSLSQDEVDHLFFPGGQDSDRFGGDFLNDSSTRKQVADNIWIFLQRFHDGPLPERAQG